jgi:hypothetical protein
MAYARPATVFDFIRTHTGLTEDDVLEAPEFAVDRAVACPTCQAPDATVATLLFPDASGEPQPVEVCGSCAWARA